MRRELVRKRLIQIPFSAVDYPGVMPCRKAVGPGIGSSQTRDQRDGARFTESRYEM